MENDNTTEKDDKNVKNEFEFDLDKNLKRLFRALDHKQVIEILNYISNANFPIDGIVEFNNTEQFDVTGDDKKKKIITDNSIKIIENDKSYEKLILEFQAKKFYDKRFTMGFRLYMYTIEPMERVKENGEYIFNAPHAMTIYTDLSMPSRGVDTMIINYPSFWAGDTEFFGKDKNYFKIEYPYINLLGMDFKDFKDTPLEVLQVIFLYRYRKEYNLLKGHTFEKEIDEIIKNFEKYDYGISHILYGIYKELFIDIMDTSVKYNLTEEIEIMRTMKKTYGDLLNEQYYEHIRKDKENSRVQKEKDKEIARLKKEQEKMAKYIAELEAYKNKTENN